MVSGLHVWDPPTSTAAPWTASRSTMRVMPQYTDQELLRNFQRALQRTRREPGNLISRRVGERAVTHRIALHLQALFPQYQVDCEYNRNDSDSKRVNIELDQLTEDHRARLIARRVANGSTQEDAERLTEYEIKPVPDILIHRRLTNRRNLLIAEVKYAEDQRGAEGERYDIAKLRAFTARGTYNYQLGVFVVLGREDDRITCVKNGEQAAM